MFIETPFDIAIRISQSWFKTYWTTTYNGIKDLYYYCGTNILKRFLSKGNI